MSFKYYVVLILILNMSCKSNEATPVKTFKDSSVVFETKKVEEKLINANNTLALILNYQLTMDLPITFNYSVIELDSKKVLKKGVFTGVKMEWHDLDKIKGHLYKGIIKKQDDVIDENKINKSNDNFILIHLNKK